MIVIFFLGALLAFVLWILGEVFKKAHLRIVGVGVLVLCFALFQLQSYSNVNESVQSTRANQLGNYFGRCLRLTELGQEELVQNEMRLLQAQLTDAGVSGTDRTGLFTESSNRLGQTIRQIDGP